MNSAHHLPWPSTAKIRNLGKHQGLGIDIHPPSLGELILQPSDVGHTGVTHGEW